MDKYRAGEIVNNSIKLTMEERGVDYLTAYDIMKLEKPGLLEAYARASINDAKRINILRETLRVKYPGMKWLWGKDYLLRDILAVIEENGGDKPLPLQIGEALKRRSAELLGRFINEQE